MMVFADSFNLYTQAFMGDMWDVVEVGVANRATLAQSLTSGRFGSGGVTFAIGTNTSTATLAYMQKNFSGKSTIICGLAVQQTATQAVGHVTFNTQGGRLLTFVDGASMQVGLNILPSGQIQAVSNVNAGEGAFPAILPTVKMTTLGISTNAISSSSYDFLEVKVVFHASAGSIEILRNGEAFWNPTGLNTAISGVANCSSIIVGGAYWSAGGTTIGQPLQAIVSDVHILNTTANGSDALDPVNFIGDRHWEAVSPATDGFYTDWTPDPSVPGATEHTLNVETIPPDTVKNNNTDVVGERDSFNCDDATGPSAASVILAYTPYLQKNAGGAVGVSGFFRLAGSNRSGTEFQVANPYAFRQSFLCSKPGGGAITIADVNAGEHGYIRSS